jgi:hypothetical protein
MNRPLVASLLVTWCVFVVAPAWVVYFAFRGIDANTPIIGPIIAIWIVGYLLQFGTFMAVARKAGGNSVVGWLLASTMPFVADWTVPVAPWSPVAVVVVVGAYAVWFYSRLARSDDLQHNGIPATGTVLEVKQPVMNMIVNSVYLRRTVMLRIDRADGTPPYEAKYSGTFMLGDLPSVGDVFNLRVDSKNPKHFETTEGTSVAAQPSTWSPPPATVADQLQQLDDMHQRGALTDYEFAAAKQQVLRG